MEQEPFKPDCRVKNEKKYNVPERSSEVIIPSIFGIEPEKLQTFKERLKEVLIDPNNPAPEPESLLSLRGTSILWRGCKSFVCAVAKARKTTTLTLLCSVMMGRDESARGFDSKKNIKVLYIDTEQAQYDSQRIFNRVAELSGKNTNELSKYFQILSLNQFNYEEIKGFIEAAVTEFKPDVLILDNWTDCVKTIMDDEQCTQFSRDLRQLAEVYNLAIFSVIHANESARNDDKPNFRGWGAEEARKSDLTMFLKDMSDNTKEELRGDYSQVTFGRCRGKRPDGFNVSIDENGLPFLYEHNPYNQQLILVDKYADIVSEIPTNGITNKDLLKLIQEKRKEVNSDSTAKEWVKRMSQNQIIEKIGEGKNTRYYKPKDNHKSEELPF